MPPKIKKTARSYFTELFFAPFRKILPPFGMLDLSPILAFIVLRIVQVGIFKLLAMFGL